MFSEWARQLQKETDTLQDAIRDYERHVEGASTRKDFTAQAPTRRLLLEWYPILVDAISKEQQAVRRGCSCRPESLYTPLSHSCPLQSAGSSAGIELIMRALR